MPHDATRVASSLSCIPHLQWADTNDAHTQSCRHLKQGPLAPIINIWIPPIRPMRLPGLGPCLWHVGVYLQAVRSMLLATSAGIFGAKRDVIQCTHRKLDIPEAMVCPTTHCPRDPYNVRKLQVIWAVGSRICKKADIRRATAINGLL